MTAVLLGGCSTPQPEHFYTLSGGADAQPAKPVKYYVEVLAVSVPQQVSRNQFVVTAPSGRIELLEQQRWAGPLAGEIGQSLSTAVTNELGAIDVFRTPHPDNLPVYRISTNVQRFESVMGQYALIDAVWSVRQLAGNKVVTCRTVANEKVAAGYDELVTGHRRAVARIATDMAGVVRALEAGNAACPAT
ncbi:PqiC family protein [Janthinobacterium sp. 1_2014MBL_MicDiv]|uniref:PqiC family protein n=1 Tax=Janthinobacterium sp. 1_2014MBL_MicDiv TaxID=1644131 RepID=UPI001E3F21FB|nr:PqiC family protein [Janthinobacterium sp. 1_2014MBL_MicDiv]